MIKTMPVEPDLFVWGALLAGCRNHGHMELAEVTALHLKELELESAANRLLLYSVYAAVEHDERDFKAKEQQSCTRRGYQNQRSHTMLLLKKTTATQTFITSFPPHSH